MTNVLLELDQILSKGTGWWGELPEDVKPMSGHMRFCIGLTLELEYKVADIRSLDAHGPTERLRSDLERLVVVMRQALEIYQTDIWKRYLAVKGEQIEYASDAREPTVTLETQHIPLLQELRREAEMLFLTSIYRLGASKIFASYEVNWPIDRRPGANLDIGPLWGGDVRPLLD